MHTRYKQIQKSKVLMHTHTYTHVICLTAKLKRKTCAKTHYHHYMGNATTANKRWDFSTLLVRAKCKNHEKMNNIKTALLRILICVFSHTPRFSKSHHTTQKHNTNTQHKQITQTHDTNTQHKHTTQAHNTNTQHK